MDPHRNASAPYFDENPSQSEIPNYSSIPVSSFAPDPSWGSNRPQVGFRKSISEPLTDTEEERYRNLIERWEINADFAKYLQQLRGFKIVFVFDDSGSMDTPLIDSPLNGADSSVKATRWDELLFFTTISLEIATLFDPQGCSIYFLNKRTSPVHNVKDESQIIPLFEDKPSGYTPLAKVFNQVLKDNETILNEQKLLVVVVTDGEPTDEFGKQAIYPFRQAIQNRHKNVYTSIVACTDDQSCVEYLNRWDRDLPRLDVVDDFRSERDEVQKAKGVDFPFTFGDYVVKALVGSIDPDLDNMDENSVVFKSRFRRGLKRIPTTFLSLYMSQHFRIFCFFIPMLTMAIFFLIFLVD